MAELAKGGRSTAAATGAATTRPAPRSIGTRSASRRLARSRTIRCASSTEISPVSVLTVLRYGKTSGRGCGCPPLQRNDVREQVGAEGERERACGAVFLDRRERHRP